MATRYAVATGNWSNPATWDGGVSLPGVGDDVYADGKTVTIDMNITVLSLRTTARSGGTAGGGFTVADATLTLTITGTGILAGSSTCVSYAGATLLTIIGSVTASTTATAVTTTGTGAVSVIGNITCQEVGNIGGAHGVYTTGATGSVTVIGNIIGGCGSSGGSRAIGVYTTGIDATVTVTGSLTGRAASGSTGAQTGCVVVDGIRAHVTVVGDVTASSCGSTFGSSHAIWTGSTAANITVTGNVSARSGGHGIYCSANSATRVISVVGNVSGGSPASGLVGTCGIFDLNVSGGYVVVAGSLTDSANGDPAVMARRFKCTTTANTYRQHANSTGGSAIVYRSEDSTAVAAYVPLPADVRDGVAYGTFGSLVGTCSVPPAASVGYGIPVDNTTGTAALSPSDIAALVGAQIAAVMNAVP